MITSEEQALIVACNPRFLIRVKFIYKNVPIRSFAANEIGAMSLGLWFVDLTNNEEMLYVWSNIAEFSIVNLENNR